MSCPSPTGAHFYNSVIIIFMSERDKIQMSFNQGGEVPRLYFQQKRIRPIYNKSGVFLFLRFPNKPVIHEVVVRENQEGNDKSQN